ncbi:MAG: nucleoside deaminase [Gammaproteobacteria bacterium]|nr:nucleoside deaminase [Gammaproteobacteria bacterium]
MSQALEQAKLAATIDEVPVGAVLINADNELIAEGHNQPISACDPTAHAEIIVLREAARQLNNYRLPNTTLYVTLEPCTMCVGALVQARVARIVYSATEPKTGAIESVHRLFEGARFNHRPEVCGGVLAGQSSVLLSSFFQQKRTGKLQPEVTG